MTGSESRGKALVLFPVPLLPSPYVLQLKILETTGSGWNWVHKYAPVMNRILELGIIRSVGWIMSQMYCASLTRELLQTMTVSDLQAAYHIHASILEANNVHETVCNQNSKFWYSWTSLQRSPWGQNKVAVVMSQCMDFSPPGPKQVAFVES